MIFLRFENGEKYAQFKTFKGVDKFLKKAHPYQPQFDIELTAKRMNVRDEKMKANPNLCNILSEQIKVMLKFIEKNEISDALKAANTLEMELAPYIDRAYCISRLRSVLELMEAKTMLIENK